MFFFFKQKTAYEMRISDWSSDVCSSDLAWAVARSAGTLGGQLDRLFQQAFAAAKRARTDTRIGANPVSVASTAVRLALGTFARPEDAAEISIGSCRGSGCQYV